VIELDGVEKTFSVRVKRGRLRRERREVRAVDGISFRIEPGELVGYVGPNGAGKSTTVKMLTGILVPSGGRISVAGLDPSRRRIQLARRIGVVFGQRVQLWWDLPLRDSFELLRHIYRVPSDRWRANLDRFTEVLELEPFLETPVRQLSLGQRMRGELTAAMLHDPEILFLDEPTIGLDVVAKVRVREFLAEINREREVTVLLTTHDLADIERLCSRLLIIDHGRVIYDGTIERLIERYGEERTLVVDLEEPAPPLELDGARVVRVEGPRQWLRFRRH
jgi:ABC-2 type transport system ATP-binding protein